MESVEGSTVTHLVIIGSLVRSEVTWNPEQYSRGLYTFLVIKLNLIRRVRFFIHNLRRPIPEDYMRHV